MVMRIKEDPVCLVSGVSLVQFTESRDLAVAMFILANGRNTENMLRRHENISFLHYSHYHPDDMLY